MISRVMILVFDTRARNELLETPHAWLPQVRLDLINLHASDFDVRT